MNENFNVNDEVHVVSTSGQVRMKILRIRDELYTPLYLVAADDKITPQFVHAEIISKAFNVGDQVISSTRHHHGEKGKIFRTYMGLDYCTIEWESGVISNKAINGVKRVADIQAETKKEPLKYVFIVPAGDNIFSKPPILGYVDRQMHVSRLKTLNKCSVISHCTHVDIIVSVDEKIEFVDTPEMNNPFEKISIDNYLHVVEIERRKAKASIENFDKLLTAAKKLMPKYTNE